MLLLIADASTDPGEPHDAKADRKAGLLRVFAVHRDTEWSARQAADVAAEIAALAGWLGLELTDAE